jgi:hypothetical protein
VASTPVFDVFLSYHSGDAEWVARLKTALESYGLTVWLDTEQIRPGDVFPGRLARAIGNVRCVVIMLSRGALRSRWVEEEYSLALAHGCHTIAVLIDEIEPPGFLAGRTFVDFRDDEQFAANVKQLVFGISGQRVPGAAAAEPASFRSAEAEGTDEADVLKRLIERSRRNARPLWHARVASALIGVVIGAAFFAISSDASLTTRVAVFVFAPGTLSTVVWALTTTGLTRIDSRVEQFELLRDGLEACRSRSHPGCRRLRQQFWDMLSRAAADITARPI